MRKNKETIGGGSREPGAILKQDKWRLTSQQRRVIEDCFGEKAANMSGKTIVSFIKRMFPDSDSVEFNDVSLALNEVIRSMSQVVCGKGTEEDMALLRSGFNGTLMMKQIEMAYSDSGNVKFDRETYNVVLDLLRSGATRIASTYSVEDPVSAIRRIE